MAVDQVDDVAISHTVSIKELPGFLDLAEVM
jgi:hypothetical protein